MRSFTKFGTLAAVVFLGLTATPASAQFKIKKASDDRPKEPTSICADNDILNTTHIHHDGVEISYNAVKKVPNWVAYELTSKKVDAFDADRVVKETYSADPRVGNGGALPSYYSGSVYEMALMVPYEDMMWSKSSLEAAFLMSNIAPMNEVLNIGLWYELELLGRQWAKKYDTLYIISGTYFFRPQERYLEKGNVGVPDMFYKIFVQKRDGEWHSIAYVIPNLGMQSGLEQFLCPVAAAEEMLGITLFTGFTEEAAIRASFMQMDSSEWTGKAE